MRTSAQLFKWRGISSDGVTVDGMYVAEDESVLLHHLENQGIILTKGAGYSLSTTSGYKITRLFDEAIGDITKCRVADGFCTTVALRAGTV